MKKRILLFVLAAAIMLAGCSAGKSGDDNVSDTDQPTSVGRDEETDTTGTGEETDDMNKVDPNGDGVMSVLAIGNSFSDDALTFVYDIAKSAGIEKVVIGDLYYGGCRIYQHYDFWSNNKPVYNFMICKGNGTWKTSGNSVWTDALRYTDWDYISFQESAQEKQSNESLYEHLQDLMDMANKECPNAKFIYHMPWPNPHANYGRDIGKMYTDCMMTLDMIIDKYGFENVITTGTAIQNLRTSYIGYEPTVRDGWHLSLGIGRYTASLAFFTQLTGISVEDNEYMPSGVNKNEKLVAIESAMNSLKSRRAVIQSEYTVDPDKERIEHLDEYYDVLEVEYLVGYWNAASNKPFDDSGSDFARGFRATPVYTADTLPVGSLVIVKDGFRIRPEGWTDYPNALKIDRAPFLTDGTGVVLEIDEAWYSTYKYRAFNITGNGGSARTDDELTHALTIYIPKK